jgi:hypothetical protein
MKKFIVKTFIFIIFPIFIYVSTWFLLNMTFRNKIDQYDTFIFGDSQTEFIKFPEIYNNSIHGSPYYLHYEFAKEFIDQIKGKKVYIAYNYHNQSNLYQNRLANDSFFRGWRENTFRNIDKYKLFNYEYPEIRPKDLEYSFLDFKKVPRLFKTIYFSKDNKNNLESIVNDTLAIKNSINQHWNEPKYVLNDSIQKKYLEKLIVLLKDNNCDVILLKMPLTRYYINNVPSETKKKVNQLSNNPRIRLLDLNNNLKISKDYIYFKDYGHLNKKGDSIVSEYFKKNELKQQ